MSLERGTFAWGGATFPLAAATTNTLLLDADPSVYRALDFYSSLLQIHLGARWAAACTDVGFAQGAAIVQTACPYDPAPYLTTLQIPLFPLLAVYRVSAKASDKTVLWEHTISQWRVQFSLPALSPGQAEKLMPFLHAAMAVIVDRTTEQSDPAYTPQGGVAGANVWGLAGLEEVGITDVQYGNMPADMGKLWLPTALLSMYVIERKNAVAGAFQPLGGTDVTIGVQVGAGALLPDVADFKT